MTENGSKSMHTPRWKYEINPNTLVSVVTLLGLIAGAGVMYQSFNTALSQNTTDIAKLQVDFRRLDDAWRISQGKIDGIDNRLTSVEGTAREAIVANQATATTLGELKSDVRLVAEILKRLEAASTRAP